MLIAAEVRSETTGELMIRHDRKKQDNYSELAVVTTSTPTF